MFENTNYKNVMFTKFFKHFGERKRDFSTINHRILDILERHICLSERFNSYESMTNGKFDYFSSYGIYNKYRRKGAFLNKTLRSQS